MLLWGKLEQLDSQQRAVGQIKGLQRLALSLGRDRLLTLNDGQQAEIQLLDLEGNRERRLFEAVIGILTKHRAQGFVALHQVGKGLLQRGAIQRAGQAYRARQVIGTTVGVELP